MNIVGVENVPIEIFFVSWPGNNDFDAITKETFQSFFVLLWKTFLSSIKSKHGMATAQYYFDFLLVIKWHPHKIYVNRYVVRWQIQVTGAPSVIELCGCSLSKSPIATSERRLFLKTHMRSPFELAKYLIVVNKMKMPTRIVCVSDECQKFAMLLLRLHLHLRYASCGF